MKTTIIYASASKIPRRIIVDDHVTDPADHAMAGESFLSFDHTIPAMEIRHAIARHHGINHNAIPSGRCAVVDANHRVVGIIMADPALDDYPGCTLVASDTARPDDMWQDGRFEAPT